MTAPFTELAQRSIYRSGEEFCRAGGYHPGYPLHPNYGLPCVTGAIYWEDGEVTLATNCVFCGRPKE